MSASDRFEFDSVQDVKSIQEFLLALAAGFDNGRIVLRSDADEVILHPRQLVGFSVKAKRKDSENKIAIKVSWKDARKETFSKGKSVQISS